MFRPDLEIFIIDDDIKVRIARDLPEFMSGIWILVTVKIRVRTSIILRSIVRINGVQSLISWTNSGVGVRRGIWDVVSLLSRSTNKSYLNLSSQIFQDLWIKLELFQIEILSPVAIPLTIHLIINPLLARRNHIAHQACNQKDQS